MRLKVFAKAAAWALSPRRHYSSALFISDRSSKEHPILTPTPDLQSRFENLEKLQTNINIRKMTANAAELKELWEFYRNLKETREHLEKRRTDIAEQMSDLNKVGGREAIAETEKLRQEGRLLRQDLKDLLQAFWEVEERTMINCLALPNDLHPKTPLSEDSVILQKISPRDPAKLDHLQVGKDLIDYRSPHWYYLKNSAAIFDQALNNYFLHGFKNSKFIPMVPPDFTCAALVEGCGVLPENSLRLKPIEENMHLVGGASLPALSAFYAKFSLPYKIFPVHHVTAGKKYLPANGSGLFGAWQRTCVDFFVACPNATSLDGELENVLENLKQLYEQLGWDYRLVFLSAPKLNFSESFRASFQMFSSSLDDYVEVGCVSVSGSFLAERLSMQFGKLDKSKGFCHTLSGTAVDVTLVLACLLENNVSNLLHAPLVPFSFASVP